MAAKVIKRIETTKKSLKKNRAKRHKSKVSPLYGGLGGFLSLGAGRISLFGAGRVSYRKGVNTFPNQPRNFFQREWCFQYSRVKGVLVSLSRSNMALSSAVGRGSKMKAFVS